MRTSTGTRPRSRRTAVDLFSGCGGLTQGLKSAGFRVLAAVDNDSLAAETYSANHPEVRTHPQDIRTVNPKKLRRKLALRRGQLDLLAGCPPCQGFSTIRTRNNSQPVDDPRNALIFEFIKFIREFKPKAVMIENVPPLAKDRRIAELSRVLTQLGYSSSHQILDAADYSVPQRRRRMILLAGRFGTITFPKPRRQRRTVRRVIGRLPSPNDPLDPLHYPVEHRSERIMQLIRAVPKNGGSRKDLDKRYQLRCHARCDGFKDVYGRMPWNDVAPTITSGCINPSRGRFLHPEADRAITLREAALLQTFPRTYLFSMRRGRYAVAALIGNALPPNFARAQGHAVEKYLASLTERWGHVY